MVGSWWRSVQSRVVLIAASAALALGRGCSAELPPPATLEGLVQLLRDSAEVQVRAGEFGWEPSSGPLLDLVFGRQILFLGCKPGAPRDVYRAAVAVSWEGKPLFVQGVRNLTQTPMADEVGLQVSAGFAAYSTLASNSLVAVSLLEPSPGAHSNSPWSWLGARWQAKQRYGTWRGLGETHFDVRDAVSVSVSLSPPILGLDLGPGRSYVYGLQERSWVNEGDPHAAKSPRVWRRSDGELIRARTLIDSLLGAEPEFTTLAQTRKGPPFGTTEQPWPPAALTLSDGSGGDAGQWLPVGPEAGANEPSLLFHTRVTLRDRAIEVVAIDTRRLELHLQSGFAAPRAWTGPNGDGRLASEPELRKRLVALFNGGVAQSSVAGLGVGLISQGHVDVPPSAGLSSMVVTQAGFVGLGSAPQDLQLDDVESLRQYPTGSKDSAVPPSGAQRASRQQTEPVEAGEGMSERSALCLRPSGLLLYAWGSDWTRAEWEKALSELGCARSLGLAAGNGARGFLLLQPGADGAVHTKPLHEDMHIDDRALRDGEARDYFYLARRPSSSLEGAVTWQVSPGAQPEPSYVPGLFSAQAEVGGLAVELFSVDAGRVQYAVTAGSEEPLLPSSSAPVRELSVEDRNRTLFAFNLGHTTRATRYGLSFDGRETLPLRRVYGTLVLRSDGRAEIIPAGQSPSAAAGTIQVQLPALVSAGQLEARAHEAGGQRRRGALCVRDDGRLLVAFVDHDSSDPLAIVLRERGCNEVLELDRASQHAAILYRAGTPLQVPDAAETTLLIGLSKPMAQRTFALDAD